MRLSQSFIKTRKQVPSDETAKNAKLLIQAGFIHKEMAGVYSYTTLGLKVLENIKQIVREEMNSIGGQEVQMTVLQPKEIWEKTDRWDDSKVDNWFKTKLANGTELGVGLTHEEPIVDLLKDYLSSYKDLPIFVYQIQSKFRNELRAKSGLLRGREFIMKDMYSFARSQKEHDELYEQAAKAYSRVYDRLGIGKVTYRVKADGGIFTDKYSDEYQTISPIGEDTLFNVPGTDKFFNEEVAPSNAPQISVDKKKLPIEDVEGKGIVGVEALAKFLNIPVEKTTKTMIYQTDSGEIIAAAVRGGYEVNEIKLRKVIGTKGVKLADEATVKRVTKAEIGYAGLLNLPKEVRLIVDESCSNRTNFETGANKTNFHTINVNWDRDIPMPKEFYDIKVAKLGDSDPESGKVYETKRAVEVGNIFPLESKYSDALNLYYIDESGKRQSIVMGCYGIGVSRLAGLLAEYFSDDKGLVWPENIAPAQVYLVRLGDSGTTVKYADRIYKKLVNKGIETIYDDRDMRPGEKFADADLMGIPHRVVISDKTIQADKIEYKRRSDREAKLMNEEEFFQILK
ncbi:proline--tRNA ligase [Candidatus Saccharibacteria bacterium]|nr:proline--tRNA ligase [Candidatus Saccharibacteria bacterium]